MSTAPTSLDEVRARIECGMAGIKDAAYLMDLLERLTYPEVDGYSSLCRICGLPRHIGHENDCHAREVI